MIAPIRVRHAKVYLNGKEIGETVSDDRFEIVDGHHRALAAEQLGIAPRYEFATTAEMSPEIFEDLQRSIEPVLPLVKIGGLKPPTDADYRWARRMRPRAKRRFALHVLDLRRKVCRVSRWHLASGYDFRWTLTPAGAR